MTLVKMRPFGSVCLTFSYDNVHVETESHRGMCVKVVAETGLTQLQNQEQQRLSSKYSDPE
jgi:hypothetical protein